LAVPIISIVGNSESGKTTLIEKIIPALKIRGYRVGSIKHAREVDFETEKDNQRHLAAGSEMTILASPGQIIMFKPVDEPKIDDIVKYFDSDLDLIICEGFKSTDLPKIEVYRKGNGAVIEGLTGVVAIVSDERLDVKTRQIRTDDVESIVDLLEKGLIQPQRQWLDLYINGKSVPLTVFPRQVINNVITAMVLTLKNIGAIKTLEIKARKEI
jgi:molybdopterin-guanine dinucleotide biosynthesis protein B